MSEREEKKLNRTIIRLYATNIYVHTPYDIWVTFALQNSYGFF